MSAEQLRQVSTRRFLVLLTGLPAEAAFPRVWARTPRAVTDPREIAALTGTAAGSGTGNLTERLDATNGISL